MPSLADKVQHDVGLLAKAGPDPTSQVALSYCGDVPAMIFDYDGLIVDSETTAATVVLELLAERGVERELGSIAHFFGRTGPDNDRAWERLIRQWLGPGTDVAAFDAEAKERLEPRLAGLPLLPGVVELLDVARDRDWQVGLGSGQGRIRLESNLRRLAIRDRFDVIVTAADVAKGKPAPDIFLEVARRLGVAPADCIVFEDSKPGCEAALDAGMTVISCPCRVTRCCPFPPGVQTVSSLLDVRLPEALRRGEVSR